MPFSRHLLRELAAYMLLVWVFALGAGTANACGLASGAGSGHAGETASITRLHAVAAEPHGAHESQQAGTATCIKFCDDDKALTESKVPGTPSLALLETTLPGLRLHAPAEPDRLNFISGDLQDRMRRPAVPVTILRLTL